MKTSISIISSLVLLGFIKFVCAVDLTDMPNESSFANAKSIINSNNSLIKTAIGDLSAGTIPNLGVTTNITVGDSVLGDKMKATSAAYLNMPEAGLPKDYFGFMDDFFICYLYTYKSN